MEKKLYSVLEQIEQFIAGHPTLSKEILVGKKEFFEKTGKLRETDPSYTQRLNAFLMWFIFDRTLTHTHTNTIPFDIFMRDASKQSEQIDLSFCSQLIPHLHSLFILKKITKEYSVIKDIIHKKKYKIPQIECMVGIEKDTIFETRMFDLEGTKYFANYFIFHPQQVNKQIIQQIKLIRKAPKLIPNLIIKLHHFHTKFENYRNMDIRFIYHFDKQFPEIK